MIEALRLNKSYRKQPVLSDASFTLNPGRVMGILGPNGAGKTTLIRILACIIRPDSGTLRYDGHDAFRETRLIRPMIGYVPQDVALFDDLTVWDNLLCWSGLRGREARAQAGRLIETLSLEAFAGKKISALSGGMKRRVNLAVAMLDNPRVLILDEPLVGVDIEQRRQIADSLKSLAGQGVTQIIASHHVDEMMPLVDEVMVMGGGDILFRGAPGHLIAMREKRGETATLDDVVLQILHEKKGGKNP